MNCSILKECSENTSLSNRRLQDLHMALPLQNGLVGFVDDRKYADYGIKKELGTQFCARNLESHLQSTTFNSGKYIKSNL